MCNGGISGEQGDGRGVHDPSISSPTIRIDLELGRFNNTVIFKSFAAPR